MEISNFTQFEDFLQTRIPTREALFVGDMRLKRAKYFMRLLGNPQNKLKVIHIAGTSGKGSTAQLTSQLLQSQGFKVGLSLSPHVFDLRERMQINNQLPDEKLILKYFKQILPTILKMENCKYGAPTFFEICVGLAYYLFYQEKMDYAVIETGLGGTLDGTNVVSSKNKICLITKLGLDHTEILGNAISQIAEQKAGIIQKQNSVLSIYQTTAAQKVLQKKCQEKNADLNFITRKNYSLISSSAQETIFDFNFSSLALKKSKFDSEKQFKFKKIKLSLAGAHQAQNCSLALACLIKLSQRDKFPINEKLLRNMLRNTAIAGRMEIFKIKGQTIILDGAHNPQKMQTLISALSTLYPGQKLNFIVAFKRGKDYQKMLQIILPFAEQIYLSHFPFFNQASLPTSIHNREIAKFLQKQNFANFKILQNEVELLETIFTAKKPVAFTGSIYFIACVHPLLT